MSSMDAVKKQQAYVTQVYALLAFAAVTTFGILHIFADELPEVGYAEVVGGAAMVLVILGLRITHNIRLARAGFLSVIMALLAVMLITGGTAGTGILWFFMFPVSAFFLGGKREGVWWMTALVAMVLALFVLSQTSLLTLYYPPLVIRQLLVTLAVVSIGMYVYQNSRELLARETSRSVADLAEEKIRASTVLENLDEGVVTTDEQGRVIMMNKAAQTMLGWKLSELKDKSFAELVPLTRNSGEPLGAANRPSEQALSREGSTNYRLQYQRKNGSTFPAEVAAKSVVIDDKIVGAVNTFRDITAELAVERAKSEFVTLASHQLRTPISAIRWFGEMLLSGDVGHLDTEQRKHIEQIYHSNQRMANLVDEMLIVSSLELGSMPVRPEPLDVATFCRRITRDQQPAAAEKRLTLKHEFDKNLGKLSLDPHILKIILRHLLSNAIKYTREGGSISLVVTATTKKLTPQSKGSLAIMLNDNGYGIPKAEQSQIFKKFYRGKNIKDKDTDGTGLGLYVVKMLLQYVGGSISFSSTENVGSTFVVELPLEGMQAH